MRCPIKPFLSRCCLLAALAAGSAAAITPADLAGRLARNEPLLIIDVRAGSAYEESHIPGAINIPLGLLPHKPLPSSQPVVVYGDGLGVVDDARALAAVRSKPGVTAEVLEGGFAGWLSETRLSTAAPGVTRERVPGITYQQLLAAGKSDMVIVDLRTPGAAPAVAAARQDRPATAAMTRDIVAEFAQKLGVPVVSPSGLVVTAAAPAQRAASSTGGTPPKAAAAPVEKESKSARLLVLVADSDTAANEAARQLRASGHYRFTVLIGGTEIIRHEGRQGTGRMDGDLPIVPSRP